MNTMKQSATIIELARDLMAACGPVTGTRGSGKLLVRTKADAPVFLPRNWALIPVVNGAAREDLLFKVAAGPSLARFPDGKRAKASEDEPDAESWWTVQPSGTIVSIHSIIGGKRHNLPRGTKFIFDPQNPSLELDGILQADITDAADPVHFGGCMSMAQFEQLNGPQATLDAFRAELGKLPAVVFVWAGSQPADGTTQSSLNRGQTRVGQARQLFKEQFDVFVISERSDSGGLRRAEGLKLLDDISFWLTDRQAVDGEIFSSPAGVQIRGRARVAGDNASYQSVYVYLLQLSVTHLWTPYDSREFVPWLRTHNDILTFQKDGDGLRKVVVSQDIDMTTGSE